jgi:hypothetical protein
MTQVCTRPLLLRGATPTPDTSFPRAAQLVSRCERLTDRLAACKQMLRQALHEAEALKLEKDKLAQQVGSGVADAPSDRQLLYKFKCYPRL